MRLIAVILVIVGLVTILVGEIAVFLRHEELELGVTTSQDIGAIREAQRALSMWPGMALGASITGVGILLNVLARKAGRRRAPATPSYEAFFRSFRK